MPGDGVLLVNLGVLRIPEKETVGRFLAEFLPDPRVVDWLNAPDAPIHVLAPGFAEFFTVIRHRN